VSAYNTPRCHLQIDRGLATARRHGRRAARVVARGDTVVAWNGAVYARGNIKGTCTPEGRRRSMRVSTASIIQLTAGNVARRRSLDVPSLACQVAEGYCSQEMSCWWMYPCLTPWGLCTLVGSSRQEGGKVACAQVVRAPWPSASRYHRPRQSPLHCCDLGDEPCRHRAFQSGSAQYTHTEEHGGRRCGASPLWRYPKSPSG
jgi:hypothetical protein